MKAALNLYNKAKSYWMRFVLRGIHYSSNFKRMNMFYLVVNPWFMDSVKQQYRFEETNRLIKEKYGPIRSLLEIGCGEGHQSLYLMKVCDEMTGLDVSERAIRRARKKCPQAHFIVGDLFSEEGESKSPYDLVVACEVLYYLKNVSASLERLRALGRNCLVTYKSREMDRLDRQVLLMPGIKTEIIEIQNTRWRVAFWPGIPS